MIMSIMMMMMMMIVAVNSYELVGIFSRVILVNIGDNEGVGEMCRHHEFFNVFKLVRPDNEEKKCVVDYDR